MPDIEAREFGKLEATVQHLTRRIEELEQSIDRLEGRIASLTAILDQARGARWLFAGLIGAASFIAGMAAATRGFWR